MSKKIISIFYAYLISLSGRAAVDLKDRLQGEDDHVSLRCCLQTQQDNLIIKL